MSQPPYACHNREPFRTAALVQDGWWERPEGQVRTPNMTIIPFRNSQDCNYTHTDLGRADPRCAGCKHRVTSVSADLNVTT